jgi:hypothetical protein
LLNAAASPAQLPVNVLLIELGAMTVRHLQLRPPCARRDRWSALDLAPSRRLHNQNNVPLNGTRFSVLKDALPMWMNSARMFAGMTRRRLDAIVATMPENVTYPSGFRAMSQSC